MTLEQIYDSTLRFFVECINKPQSTNDKEKIVTQHDDYRAFLYFDNGQLIFSIEGLYQHLAVAPYFTYNQYRRMLYSSELNKDLSACQAKIVNHSSDHDVHLFCLATL